MHPNQQVSDKDITELFGLRPADRDRGMKLFRGGNVVSESVRITTGKMRSGVNQKVWIIEGDVVASQRGRVYRARVVFDQVQVHLVTRTHSLTPTHTHSPTHTPTHSPTHSHTRARAYTGHRKGFGQACWLVRMCRTPGLVQSSVGARVSFCQFSKDVQVGN